MEFTVWNPANNGQVISRGSASSREEAMMYESQGLRVKLDVFLDPLLYTIDPKTEEPVLLKDQVNPMDTQFQKELELSKGFSYKSHQICITDTDMSGWNEVNQYMEIMKPNKYPIETNTGQLYISYGEWKQLYKTILEKRQDIINKAFDAARK